MRRMMGGNSPTRYTFEVVFVLQAIVIVCSVSGSNCVVRFENGQAIQKGDCKGTVGNEVFSELEAKVATNRKIRSAGTSDALDPTVMAELAEIKLEIARLKNVTDLLKSGWTFIEGLAYIFWEYSMTWREARSLCQSKGGDLIAEGIRDSNAFHRIHGMVERLKRDYWIGLNDIDQEGRFVFIDGVSASTSDTFWGPKEPNDSGDCMQFQIGNRIDDDVCTRSRYPICEKTI